MISGLASFGQTTTESPYSFYGLGDINTRAFANQRSMGGAGTAFASESMINTLNPAAHANLEFVTFNVDYNLDLRTIESASVSQKTTKTYFNNLAVAFPVGSRAGFSMGLRQYTKIGYNIKANQTDPILGDYQFVYDGQGGINEFALGAGFKILTDSIKTLSFGANFLYYFGSASTNRRSTSFVDSPDALSTNQVNRSIVRDIAYDFGLYYDHKISNDFKVSVGISYAPSINIKATVNTLAYNYRPVGGDEAVKDTIVFSETKGKIKMPSSFNVGVGLYLGKSWTLLADYKIQDWSELTVLGTNPGLNTRSEFSVGIQNTPNPDAVAKFVQSLSYRVGYRFTNTRLLVNSQNVTEYGISAGLGIPILKTKTKSSVNLGMEFGNRGSKENNLIKENFTTFYLGISFNPFTKQKWFKPSKYY